MTTTAPTTDATTSSSTPAEHSEPRGPSALVEAWERLSQQRQLLLRAGAIVTLGALGVLAVAIYFVGLDQSFWEDEARTVTGWIERGPGFIRDGDHYGINNHVLFSLVAWFLTKLGGTSEVMYRLGSVLPALASIGLVAWWAWRRFGAWAASLVGVLLVTSPLYFDLSRQARGYGLTFLAAAGMLVAADHIEREGRWPAWVGFGASACVSIWTLPQALFLFLGHALVLARRRVLWAATAVTVGVVGVLTILFYRPMLQPMIDVVGTRDTHRRGVIGWGEVVTWPLHRLLGAQVDLNAPGDSFRWLKVVAAGLVIAGVVWLVRRRDGGLVLHLFVPGLLLFAVLAGRGIRIWDRYVAMGMVYAAMLLAVGVVALVMWAWKTGWPGGVVAGAVGLASIVMTVNFVDWAEPVMALPRENYEEAAAVIKGAGLEDATLLTNDKQPYAMRHYLGVGRDRLDGMEADELTEAVCTVDGPAVFIDYPIRARRRDVTPDLSCLDSWEAVRVTSPQRTGSKDSWITVWLRP